MRGLILFVLFPLWFPIMILVLGWVIGVSVAMKFVDLF
jgi:hypothetical protein